ncbi:flavodoxin family protein [Terrabacter aerolatus]|uniref:Flavodoxin n=1 Tax=Terrabacter aerolatus TaxID=422442 RepID=A0A512CZF3_9MICO|nr:flavodoxin family protein [Terrabacter aerolatus]GEO29595.1 flavodoxin [Terrabacter aerolatus]
MNVLIVHESMFGNTRQIASAIAEGVRAGTTPGGEVRVVHVDDAPTAIGDDVDLLLVGGPTHGLSMTRPQTREDATSKGAAPAREGVREWIAEVTPRRGLPVVTFDTRVHVKLLPGSAANAAAKALRHRGFDGAERGETFWVEGVAGPVLEGELERAREWGATLATRVSHGVA